MKLAMTVVAVALAFSAPAFARGGGMGGNNGHMGNGPSTVSWNVVTNTKGGNTNTGPNGMTTKMSTMHRTTLGTIHKFHLDRELRRDREEIARIKLLIVELRHRIALKTATAAELEQLKTLTLLLEKFNLQSVEIAKQLGVS